MITQTVNRLVRIYGLHTDKNSTIRYVGKTMYPLTKRLYEHVKNCSKTKTNKNN